MFIILCLILCYTRNDLWFGVWHWVTVWMHLGSWKVRFSRILPPSRVISHLPAWSPTFSRDLPPSRVISHLPACSPTFSVISHLPAWSPTFLRDLPPSHVHPELDGARQTMNHFVNRINFDLNLDQFWILYF